MYIRLTICYNRLVWRYKDFVMGNDKGFRNTENQKKGPKGAVNKNGIFGRQRCAFM